MPKLECRYCKKEFIYQSIKDFPTFPFCSEKCKLIDLGLWLEEQHKIEETLNSSTEQRGDKKDT